MMMLAEHAAKMTSDTAFGLRVGEREEPQSYGIVGYSIMTSSTVEEALHSQIRYLPIWTNVGNFKLEVDGQIAHFRWEYSADPLPESHHDYEMSLVHSDAIPPSLDFHELEAPRSVVPASETQRYVRARANLSIPGSLRRGNECAAI